MHTQQLLTKDIYLYVESLTEVSCAQADVVPMIGGQKGPQVLDGPVFSFF